MGYVSLFVVIPCFSTTTSYSWPPSIVGLPSNPVIGPGLCAMTPQRPEKPIAAFKPPFAPARGPGGPDPGSYGLPRETLGVERTPPHAGPDDFAPLARYPGLKGDTCAITER